MKNNQFARYGTAAFIIGSIFGTFFLSRPRKGAFNTKLADEQQQELDMNLTTPANGTFGVVWPIIYSGAIGLAIHQALPSQQNNPRYTKARPWWLANYALNALFGYFFRRSDASSRTGSGLTTISMLPAALGLHRQLEIGQTEVPEPENTLRKSVSMYAGWLTAATVVSAANLIQQTGYRVSLTTAKRWAYAVLSATGGLGLVVSKRLNDPYYLTTLIAAFTGIAAKQKDRNRDVALLASAWAVALTVVFVQRLEEAKSSTELKTLAIDAEAESEAKDAEPIVEMVADED